MSKGKRPLLQYMAISIIIAIGVSTTPVLAQTNTGQKLHSNNVFIIALPDNRIDVSISGGSISEALQQLSKQANFQLVGNAAYLTGGVREPVVGSFTAQEAVEKLLHGTGIEYEWDGNTLIITGRKKEDIIAPTRSDDTLHQGSLLTMEIDEVIVTARKRAERLQDVPVSVTAFNAYNLENRNMSDLSDIGQFTPNLNFDVGAGTSGGGFNSRIFIRGVGQTDFIITTDPGVGIYVDGVYFARMTGSVMDIVDLERVEVLRGPQGTLFGKNTIGGAINVVSAKPTGEFGGYLKASTGSRNLVDLKGSVDIPIAQDKLFAKIAVSFKNQDGFGHRLNFNSGTKLGELGDSNSATARGQVRWLPAENVDVLLSVDVSRQRENSQLSTLAAINSSAPLLGLWNALVAPGLGLAMDSRFLSDDPFDTFATFGTNDSVNDLDVWGMSLITDWDTGGFDIKSITAFRELKANFSQDNDASPLPFHETINRDTQSQFSQELQISGSHIDNRLNWLIGALYFSENADDKIDVTIAGGLFDALEALPGPLSPPFPPFGGQGNPANIGLELEFDVFNEISTDSYAVFGEASYDVTEKLTVTGGLRYTYEEKVASFVNRRVNSGVFVIPPTTVGDSWSAFSPKAVIKYSWNSQFLTYFSAARGFKSGGFNGRPTVVAAVDSFGPEFASSMELGAKFGSFDRRLQLNTSFFFNFYEDMQLTSVRATPEGLLIFITENAAKSEIKGFEVELKAKPISGLDIDASVGFTDFKFTELGPGATVTLDSKMPHAPKWTLNAGVQYALQLTKYGKLTLRGDYSYRSSFFTDIVNTLAISQDGYSLVSARLAFEPEQGNWQIVVFGTNLGNKRYKTSGAAALDSIGLAYANFGRPREWGMNLKFQF